MSAQDIKPDDLYRIFIGDVPPSFFIEVMVRISFLYLLLMIAMRFLGKRMAAQLTRNETAALVSLGAGVGVPMLAPERGLLPGLIVTIVVAGTSRLIALWSARNAKIENATQGKFDILIKDAVIDYKKMISIRITKERLCAQLRASKVVHLGEVERLYVEANGNFTLVKMKTPKAGLSVIPEMDKEFSAHLKTNGIMVCHECGLENQKRSITSCSNCGKSNWVNAVTGVVLK
jgi:uncharacterized membrane protein YcaP (DUF421 family)